MTEASSKPPLTPAERHLNDLWEQHLREEFVTRDIEGLRLPSNELIGRR